MRYLFLNEQLGEK